MKRLFIVGSGGHGKVVADAAEGEWDNVVFLDGGWPVRTKHAGWPIVGTDGDLFKMAAPDDEVIVAIGDGQRRMTLCSEIIRHGLLLATVIHASAVVSRHARVGRGTVVLASAIVNAGAVVGEGCVLNTGAIVEHDCSVADGVHICPGVSLAGDVKIGAGSWVGIGSVVRQGVTIGENVVIGAGSVVVKDIPGGVTAYGVPARVVGEGRK